MYYVCLLATGESRTRRKEKTARIAPTGEYRTAKKFMLFAKLQARNLCKIPLLRCKLFLQLRRDKAGAGKVVIENCGEGCTTRFSKFPFLDQWRV